MFKKEAENSLENFYKNQSFKTSCYFEINDLQKLQIEAINFIQFKLDINFKIIKIH